MEWISVKDKVPAVVEYAPGKYRMHSSDVLVRNSHHNCLICFLDVSGGFKWMVRIGDSKTSQLYSGPEIIEWMSIMEWIVIPSKKPAPAKNPQLKPVGPMLECKECEPQIMYECVQEGGPYRLGERRKMSVKALWDNTGTIIGGKTLRWQRLEEVEPGECSDPACSCHTCEEEPAEEPPKDMAAAMREKLEPMDQPKSRLEEIKARMSEIGQISIAHSAYCVDNRPVYVEINKLIDAEIAAQTDTDERLIELKKWVEDNDVPLNINKDMATSITKRIDDILLLARMK